MSCGDEHTFGGNSRSLAGVGFGLVDEIARNHTGVHDAQDESGRAIVKRECFGQEGIGHLAGGSLGEHRIYANGKAERGDVNGMCAGTEDRHGALQV